MAESVQPVLPVDRDSLVQHGFAPTRYDGQDGEYLTKRLAVDALANLGPDLIRFADLDPSELAIVEVCPDGTVQLYIPAADLLHGRHPLDSDSGRAYIADTYLAPSHAA